MDIQTAESISKMMCAQPRQVMDAIKSFRISTNLGLMQAKNYLEECSQDGQKALFDRLCADFVQSKADMLRVARDDLRRLTLYIEQLEAEIADEQ